MQKPKHIRSGFSFHNQEENKLMKLILIIQGKNIISSTRHAFETIQLLFFFSF